MPSGSSIQQSAPNIGHSCLACSTNNARTKFCENFGIREKYHTYYTEEDSCEQIYIAEELKRLAMGANKFEDIYLRGFKYKQDVVRYL